MTGQPQEHGMGGVDYPTFFEQAEVDPAVKIKWLLDWRLRAVETIQHQEAEIDRLRARCASLEAVVERFKRYDELLQAWGRRIEDGNQHVGDDPELDERYADILEALDYVALDQHATTTQEGTHG